MKTGIIKRKDLYKLVWSTPMTRLAQKFELSDVGLAKACRRYNIPRPPRGYWAKKQAGKKLKKESLPPGEDVTIEFDLEKNQRRRREIEEEAEKQQEQERTFEEVKEAASEKQHLLTERFLRLFEKGKPDEDGRIHFKRVGLPEIIASPASGERIGQFLNLVFHAADAHSIKLGREAESDLISFQRDGFDVGMYVEELLEQAEREPTDEDRRKPSWTWDLKYQRPSGRIRVQVYTGQRYYGKRQWTEGKRKTLIDHAPGVSERIDDLLTEFEEHRLAEIRREQERKEEEKRWAEEQRRKAHLREIKGIRKGRERNLLRVARLWDEMEILNRYIDECERRWGSDITEKQTEWIQWARKIAKGLDPFEMGYPDPEVDGSLDEDNIPFGGPYPTTREAAPLPHLLREIKKLL